MYFEYCWTTGLKQHILMHNYFTALFNDKQILKFRTKLTIVFFAANNHNYGDSQRTLKNRNKQQKMNKNLLITNHRPDLKPLS